MAVPQVTCNANVERNYSTSAQLITLGATATGSPTSWQWTMLDVPVGSTANVGINENFADGVSVVQNPSFYADASVSGSYVFQAIATNVDGSSNPSVDRDSGQQVVYIKTEHRSLKVPNDYQYNWSDDLNETLNALINTKLDEVEEPTVSSVALNTSTSKHGLCPSLSGDATEFLDGVGEFSTPTGVVPSAHGSTHTGTGSDSVPNVSTLASGLCPTLSNSASEYLDGEGNWNAPSVAAHNTEHITGGSDIIPEVTTTEVGLCPTLPTVDPTTKFLRGDKTWDAPPTLGAHAAEHIDSGSDSIPVATASNTGLIPVRSGNATDYFDGSGNWSVPVPTGSGTLDDAYNSGESITVDALPVTLNRTQTADDQPAQKINHAYNGNQGSGIEFIGSASSNTPDTETIRGVNVSIPKKSALSDIWYAVGGTTIAKKENGTWSNVVHGLTITKIYDIKGTSETNIWICGTAPNGSNGKAFMAIYDGVSWSIDSNFDSVAGGIDYGIARGMLVVSETEAYVIVEKYDSENLGIARFISGSWDYQLIGAGVNGPFFDLAKNGNELGITTGSRFAYTTDITQTTPSWVFGGWFDASRPWGLIYDVDGNRYVSSSRAAGNQFINFYESPNFPASFTYMNGYDGGSGDYDNIPDHRTNSIWHDGLGKIFCTANHDGSNHVFIHSIETTPVGVATTDKVFGLYGLSATDIKMGTNKTGYLKTWDGASIGDEDVGIAEDFDQVWATPPAQELWYAVGGTTIAKKAEGSWSEVTHGLTVTEIYDIKGFAADDIWICGKAPNGSNGKSFVAHYDGVSWTMDAAFDALVGSYDASYAASIYTVSQDEFYVLHSENNDFEVKICSYTTANGWVNKGGGNVDDGPYFDMAKYVNQFVFDRQNRHEYTNDIYADTPAWTTNTFVGTDRPHCTIYEPILNRYLTILRIPGDQLIRVRRTNSYPDITDATGWVVVGDYDGGSGDYAYTNGFAAHSTWHDGLGNVFHAANHSVSNHVFLYNVSTATPVGVATTDKVYGMYGLSASNIKMGTDKTGYLKIWNGTAIVDENVGVSANFKQVWGMTGSWGTARFEGSNVAFTGSGSNEASAIRVGFGATHAIKADSGIITLGKMDDPEHVAYSGSFFTKEIDGAVEACYRDDQANIIQLTKNGLIDCKDVAKIFSDDSYDTTVNIVYTQVKSFRHIIDSNRLPVRWDILVSLWNPSGTAYCEVEIGTDTVEITSDYTSETLVKGSITRTVDGDSIHGCTIRIKTGGVGTTHLKQTDIYAVYE